MALLPQETAPPGAPTPSAAPAAAPLPSWPLGLLICLDLLIILFVAGAFWEIFFVYTQKLGFKVLFYAMWLCVPPLNAIWMLWRLMFVTRDITASHRRNEITPGAMGTGRTILNRIGGHVLILSAPTLVSWAMIMIRGWQTMPVDAQFRFIWETLIYSAATLLTFLVAIGGALRLIEKSCAKGWSWFGSLSSFSFWSAWTAFAFYGIVITMVPVWMIAKWHLWLGVVAAALVTIPPIGWAFFRFAVRWRAVIQCYRLLETRE